ncbi:AraC family transcriptional regulator [Burkholderia cenocepacia]|nr:AraC family transcriptional regulator [Burkholderia cenocepacia]
MRDLAATQELFDPDTLQQKVLALMVDVSDNSVEQAVHRHRKGQLVIAHRGWVTCHIEDGLWMVPPDCAVWIPGGVAHSNRVSIDGQIALVFIEPGVRSLPANCCTLALSPLVRELVSTLAAGPQNYAADSPAGRIAEVLVEQLGLMATEELYLPMPRNERLRLIATRLAKDPSDRRTVADWGREVAMSERTLSRLVLVETGMTFGRWRRQLHIIAALQKLAGGVSVQRVSEDLGYDSVSAFITMFRNAMGKSPKSYIRARHR